jgi:hypothetical protein
MKKIIAFSLFGDAPMYWKGALLNIELAKQYYPDWICRFYVDKDSEKELIDSLEGDNVEVILVDNNKGKYYLTLCRYFPSEDNDVELYLVRDADSRITEREVNAVEEWIASDKMVHLMRDSRAHSIPILAGMMGVKNPFLKGLKNIIENGIPDFNNKFTDQIFLNNFLYPKISGQCMEHCDYEELKFSNNLVKFKVSLKEGEFHIGGCYGNEFYE